MAIRVADVNKFFAWADRQDGRYVVLRHDRLAEKSSELDLLMDDNLAAAVWAQFPETNRGIKLDIYDVSGNGRSAYHGSSHLPIELAERLLAKRTLREGAFRAAAEDELYALMYHAAYHKPLQSKLPFAGGREGNGVGPYDKAIAYAAKAANEPVPTSLYEMHERLSSAGFVATREQLVAYVQHDFRYQRKSYFHAWLMNNAPGELNLFVIRAVAVKYNLVETLCDHLRDQYEVWSIKKVRLRDRLLTMRHMRGGKWKRGGKPHFAVVVFDPSPTLSSSAERKVHPFVFNARQFEKQQWRQWFTEASGARSKDNPIHSTDNEAEAIGHLPLFFSSAEQSALLEQLNQRRLTMLGSGSEAGSDSHSDSLSS